MNPLVTFKCLFILGAAICFTESISVSTCRTPQYLELGQTGTVNCMFQEGFFGVYWYNTTDFVNNDPIIHYNGITKLGVGYESGEFDVHRNGSLIINEVSPKHERVFAVAYIYTKQEGPHMSEIRVIVFVKPEARFPEINVCGSTTNFCFHNNDLPVLCSLSEVRRNVTLNWITRRGDGDEVIGSKIESIKGNSGYTVRATVTVVRQYSPLIMLLVCRASGPRMTLHKYESVLLYQCRKVELSHETPILIYAERNSKIVLHCSDDSLGFVVWKKINYVNNTESKVLLYSVLIGEHYTRISADHVDLGPSGSLALTSVNKEHEGMYICIFGDGYKDGWITYDVKLRVVPTPSYPIVDGCNHGHGCKLEVERKGTLTCMVKRIRPQIQLQWKTLHENETDLISFIDQQLIVTSNGEAYDVSLSATYAVRDELLDRLTIECKEPGSDNIFHLKTKLDLVFIDNHSPAEKGDVPVTRNNHMWIWFAIVITIVIFFVIFFGILILIKRLKCRRDHVENTSNDQEMTKILHRKPNDVTSTLDLKSLFLRQMKETYKDWYDAIQPIPYMKEKLYCVDKVFVEGGIEFLESKEGIGAPSVWTTLESYEDVFKAFQVSSSRRILEGEPGYGNSTVTLQFAYDWCNSKPTSILKDVEILILLRLRQLGGVSSIYKAIKRFILPKDTRITETDIEHILCHSKSVVILLDGFDEYPDRDSTITPEVISIIARQMFQDFEVITTTRSSFLPKKYPPLTKRIRLTGFNEKARRQYIRKAVVGNNDESVKKIEGYLENNPVLRDLCQVPLLFVIFAHMTHENDKFSNSHSVTSFFGYMISCFHTHMKNKMKDEKLRKYELFEEDHCDLDKLAFEAFSGNKKKIVWEKDEMCRLVKPEFYEQYVRIGILVEEESVDFIDDPGNPITEHVQYKTIVRFYHKLFCEWYAAHYLAEFLQQNAAVNLHDFLRNLDPLDVQYLYRFTCGIKAESGEKLIEYLQSIEGGNTFAILCILEQTGNKMDNIKKQICKICDEGVIISHHDTLLLQRSSLQLLEEASKNEIPIELVELYNCFQEVDLSTETIKIKSGSALSSRIPIKVLRIRLYNREMTEDETISILKFSSMCSSLKKLVFGGSIPPLSFKVDPFLLKLKSRNVTVQWRLFKEHPVYILNTEIGRWEKQGSHEEPTETEFEEMHAIFTENLKNKDEKYYKDQNKKKRETLRRNVPVVERCRCHVKCLQHMLYIFVREQVDIM